MVATVAEVKVPSFTLEEAKKEWRQEEELSGKPYFKCEACLCRIDWEKDWIADVKSADLYDIYNSFICPSCWGVLDIDVINIEFEKELCKLEDEKYFKLKALTEKHKKVVSNYCKKEASLYRKKHLKVRSSIKERKKELQAEKKKEEK